MLWHHECSRCVRVVSQTNQSRSVTGRRGHARLRQIVRRRSVNTYVFFLMTSKRNKLSRGKPKSLFRDDESNHDPYSDDDGEYGSDHNYEPADEDEDSSSDYSEIFDVHRSRFERNRQRIGSESEKSYHGSAGEQLDQNSVNERNFDETERDSDISDCSIFDHHQIQVAGNEKESSVQSENIKTTKSIKKSSLQIKNLQLSAHRTHGYGYTGILKGASLPTEYVENDRCNTCAGSVLPFALAFSHLQVAASSMSPATSPTVHQPAAKLLQPPLGILLNSHL
ncbi:unnamed protein product [Parnassius apollo]|uniref:(apollo) hypothetical protein n=1 Tax=Parnassius apollo TaxID=110799 RepID=A0A8S3XVG5_PARAO|nr:unnamed protein product [Parnassius apollo]